MATITNNSINRSKVAFLAYAGGGVSINNATGAGNVWQLGTTNALTIVYDYSGTMATTGIFTAPIKGIYNFIGSMDVISYSSSMTSQFLRLNIGASIFDSYIINPYAYKAAGSTATNPVITINYLMNAGDTAYLSVCASGGASNTAKIYCSTGYATYLSGFLICEN